jgi:hypothetical protein
MRSHFFILGNGGGGTSLLCGLLGAHEKIDMHFEDFVGREQPDDELARWEKICTDAEEKGLVFGNKIPMEQFFTFGWSDDKILEIGRRNYRVLYIMRRYSKYFEKRISARMKIDNVYQSFANWIHSQELYWKFRELKPANVLYISFEELILYTKRELQRICSFFGIEYNDYMIAYGASHTGHPKYNYGMINKDKA